MVESESILANKTCLNSRLVPIFDSIGWPPTDPPTRQIWQGSVNSPSTIAARSRLARSIARRLIRALRKYAEQGNLLRKGEHKSELIRELPARPRQAPPDRLRFGCILPSATRRFCPWGEKAMKSLRYSIAVAAFAFTLPAQAATTDPEVVLYRASGVADGGLALILPRYLPALPSAG